MPSSQRELGSILILPTFQVSTSKWIPASAGMTAKKTGPLPRCESSRRFLIPNPNRHLILFLALLFLAIAIAGACAFVIFWPLALVHIRDRHPAVKAWLGPGAFLKPSALWWLLGGRYREVRDAGFTGLATPARLSLATILLGLAMGGLLWLLSTVTR